MGPNPHHALPTVGRDLWDVWPTPQLPVSKKKQSQKRLWWCVKEAPCQGRAGGEGSCCVQRAVAGGPGRCHRSVTGGVCLPHGCFPGGKTAVAWTRPAPGGQLIRAPPPSAASLPGRGAHPNPAVPSGLREAVGRELGTEGSAVGRPGLPRPGFTLEPVRSRCGQTPGLPPALEYHALL